MKLFVIQTSDGNLTIISEWGDNPTGAKQSYHNQLKNLYADKDTTQAYVAIIDEQLNVYQGFKEYVNKVTPVEA